MGWRQELRDSGKVAVNMQLALQAQERQRHIEEEQRYILQQHREDQIAAAKEIAKKEGLKQARLSNAECLRDQIAEKAGRDVKTKAQAAQMNDAERHLNK